MKTVIIEDKQRIESIILRCDVCFVGITDLEGNPYVVPMNFGYENGTVYLHSAPEGGKVEMLEHNNHVCITLSHGHNLVYQHEKVACSYSMRSESAMCRGKVTFIEDLDEKRRALDIIMRHYADKEFVYSEPAVRNVKVWQVPVEQMSGKVFGLRANENP
ncbi:pyridoxamine 5'-phosphate oxidase family protein [uncultured Bacteroides sp.]|uniref:pyridoxamine 5'-phosphate oxidase family protein n=1 Tax=uncultured Bacteroides sp. TaxID=162156 RepID=UPI0025E7041B|nr:pyridoxamine 5'-phosphate oxidase family protein [uncultured Bacteroides sp.]